ncbi:MAG: glycosyltransferase [Planctomycetes bacterium]|nr:glycosyltransferase [Planctomycetota bacterium]
MNIVVFTPALIKGDAVSTDVLGMVSALNRAGLRAFASAKWIMDGITAIPHEEIAPYLSEPEDVLIYHHSIGLDEGVNIYESLSCRKIIKFHNVTPARFFEGINNEVARACAQGIAQTDRLIGDAVAFWADSDFNGREMQARHPRKAYEVLPPFSQVDELIRAEPDLNTVALYDDWQTNVLVVGRVVPNKNNLLAVDAFEKYRNCFDPHSRLIFVGDIAQNKYCDRVFERVRQHQISRHVVVTGKVTVRQLKTFYLTAQMLLTTSSHEGFCLPLIEAMALRVPIVAVPNTAIPDTAGNTAWYADESAEKIAAVMNQVRTEPIEREKRLGKGVSRYQEMFRNDSIERRFMELFEKAMSLSPVPQN